MIEINNIGSTKYKNMRGFKYTDRRSPSGPCAPPPNPPPRPIKISDPIIYSPTPVYILRPHLLYSKISNLYSKKILRPHFFLSEPIFIFSEPNINKFVPILYSFFRPHLYIIRPHYLFSDPIWYIQKYLNSFPKIFQTPTYNLRPQIYIIRPQN